MNCSSHRWRFGPWMLLILMVSCCVVPERLAAQDQFAGKTAGQETIALCWCPPGKFRMGSPIDEVGRNEFSEGPSEVTLTQGFWMGKYEVTQAQYHQVMGGSDLDPRSSYLPIERIEWFEAAEFCEKMTIRERAAGRLPQGWEYRLPTDAQWERACRAGTSTAYSFGDDATQLGDYAWFAGNSDRKTHPVGQKKPNAWGLYDMHGNVREFVFDNWREMQVGGTDPVFQEKGGPRVIRGGCNGNDAENCRSACRDIQTWRGVSDGTGFRVAVVPVNR